MNTDKNDRTGDSKACRDNLSWSQWRDLLSLQEENDIARHVGLLDKNGNCHVTLDTIARFNAVVDFRRSMKLYDQYVNGERRMA
jgi:hypothetical protein